MKKDVLKDINTLQDNLQIIRKVAGWTAEELGERIDITKQTISNLENKNTLMTKTQYIALRTIIDYEIISNSESDALWRVVNVLLESNACEPLPKNRNMIPEIPSFLKKTEKSNKKAISIKVEELAELVEIEPKAKNAVSDWLTRIMEGDSE